jgi:predicted transcriptional regulator/transcriptional regulator with XRE-family HTH domain
MTIKIYGGPKIRHLREQAHLTLETAADRLGLSAGYLSQIESNLRPVTARVLIALSRTFGVSPAEFDADDETRLIADLREATADLTLDQAGPALREIKLAAATTPTLARQFLALHRAYRALDERLKTLDEAVSIRGQEGPEHPTPYQEVRDYFHYRNNYLDEFDVAAEALAEQLGIDSNQNVTPLLETALRERFGVTIERADDEDDSLIRRFVPETRTVLLAADLALPTRNFQLAAQIAELAFAEIFPGLLADSGLESPAAHAVARVGMTNYAAGALLMPYRRFAAAAMQLRHDIERLQKRYGTSFEQVCHRLSNLQRPGARGVPFYFVRVDQAGNITKRHSATRFQFARFGGACPLWNVHESFGHAGRILVQLAEMPDGVRYLCVGRSIVKRSGSYLQPNRHFAVGIGCEVKYADLLVYSEGRPVDGAAVPIGISCRICERLNCHQRAFPPLDRLLEVPQNERHVIPYALK